MLAKGQGLPLPHERALPARGVPGCLGQPGACPLLATAIPPLSLPPQHEGLYSDSHRSSNNPYKSSSYLDDLAFAVGGRARWAGAISVGERTTGWAAGGLGALRAVAGAASSPPSTPKPNAAPCLHARQAAWLYKATGEEPYLEAARGYLRRAQMQRVYWVRPPPLLSCAPCG